MLAFGCCIFHLHVSLWTSKVSHKNMPSGLSYAPYHAGQTQLPPPSLLFRHSVPSRHDIALAGGVGYRLLWLSSYPNQQTHRSKRDGEQAGIHFRMLPVERGCKGLCMYGVFKFLSITRVSSVCRQSNALLPPKAQVGLYKTGPPTWCAQGSPIVGTHITRLTLIAVMSIHPQMNKDTTSYSFPREDAFVMCTVVYILCEELDWAHSGGCVGHMRLRVPTYTCSPVLCASTSMTSRSKADAVLEVE